MKTHLVTLLSLFALMLVNINFLTADEIHYAVYEDQQLNFVLYPEDVAVVTFEPWKTGSWTFNTWHTNALLWDENGFVNFYWKDISDPNDPYHHWLSDIVPYIWPVTTEVLYSGQASIGYQFTFRNYTDLPMPICVLVES